MADRPEVDALYGLDPAEFTAARNALAKQLKADGDRPGALEVAALRRPSAAAGALNRLARTDPELVDAAIEAGAELRAATEAALAGDPSGLREAGLEQRRTAESVVAAALSLLGASAAGARDRVAAIVHAAAVDEAVADELRRGVVSADHDRSGLGLGSDAGPLLALVPDRPRPSAPERVRRQPEPGQQPERARPQPKPTRSQAKPSPPPPKVEDDPPRSALDRRREQAEVRKARQAEDRVRRRRLADLRADAEHTATAAVRLVRQADDAEAAAAEVRRRADDAVAASDAAQAALAAAESERR